MKASTAVRLLATLTTAVVVSGCISRHDRPANPGERTIISEDVAEKLAENGGALDTRDYPDIRCRRYKLVGTHMVTRVCSSVAEEEALAQESEDAARNVLGRQSCLSRSSLACNGGIDEPGNPRRGIAGPR